MKCDFHSLSLKHISNGRKRVLPFQVLIADSFLKRLKGLLFLSCLKGNQCAFISPCNSVHTFFMQFEIDVVFLDKSFKVVKIIQSMKRSRISTALSATYVLEFKSGFLKENEILIDDLLELIR
ncbi:DUF192 domain-containing protein [Motilimonas pumila]|uniref:DUF192 domain-containing protein n=1 Tax=Motilimonas pumila TaxID=2303987 RepID=A0A418YAF7_9GAMM|nr:DUF192 domain-containing protein [Motilimonas pumila]RJG39519.1 DUF192 domain-containing protein [Motilimonas pumila]